MPDGTIEDVAHRAECVLVGVRIDDGGSVVDLALMPTNARIKPGDRLWWGGTRVFWTPHKRRGLDLQDVELTKYGERERHGHKL